MSDEQPARVFIGAYAGGTDCELPIPLAALKQAERELDAERERRRAEAAEKAKSTRKPSGLWADSALVRRLFQANIRRGR
jgi:hypothetical protein